MQVEAHEKHVQDCRSMQKLSVRSDGSGCRPQDGFEHNAGNRDLARLEAKYSQKTVDQFHCQ